MVYANERFSKGCGKGFGSVGGYTETSSHTSTNSESVRSP